MGIGLPMPLQRGTLRAHTDRRAAPQLCKQHQQVVPRQRDAACRRRITGSREMHEDGAARALARAGGRCNPSTSIEIVEMVGAGQTIGARLAATV